MLVFLLFMLNSLSKATTCSNYPIEVCESFGCKWVNTTMTTCLGPSASECAGKTTGATCESVTGCEWSGAAAGYCDHPDLSTCIASSTCGEGCEQNAAIGICQYPSYSDCEKWSSQTSCENRANGCVWKAAEGGCSYQYPNCGVLEKAACQTTAGCSFHTSSGYCEEPSGNLCNGFSTESSCQSSGKGCEWNAGSDYCAGKNCNFESKSTCEAENGCVFVPPWGQCRSVCPGKTPAECNVVNNGCTWVNESYDCRRPDWSECSSLNKAECSATNSGCTWDVENPTQCSAPDSSFCRSLSDAQCKAEGSGCRLQETSSSYCSFDYSCDCLSEQACKEENSCEWQSYFDCVSNTGYGNCWVENGNCSEYGSDDCEYKEISYCQATWTIRCENNSIDNPTNCDSASLTAGCTWKTSNAVCVPDNQLLCQNNTSKTACSPESVNLGCKWSNERGYCSSNSDLRCEVNNIETPTGCSSQSAGLGCKWALSEPGYCYPTEEFSCRTKGDMSGCATDADMNKCMFETYSSGGCRWDDNNMYCQTDGCSGKCTANSSVECVEGSSPSYCSLASYSHYCAANNDNTACSSDSSPYCVWHSGNEYCTSSGSGAFCYNNGDGTDCDKTYSGEGCEWESSPAVCIPDYDLNCNNFENIASCVAPCKWMDVPAFCDTDNSLNCYNNATNNGCNTVISDRGCVWHGATTASCGLEDDVRCTANEANNGCSSYSSSKGCTWKSGSVGSCQEPQEPQKPGSAFLVVVPWLALLFAFAVLF